MAASPPRRVQLQRSKGWRKPAGVVTVARPSRWGNPFRISPTMDRAASVAAFEAMMAGDPTDRDYPPDEEIRAELRGRDLACWCPLDQRCHADVLLEIANR